MERLKESWLTDGLIDFEYKKYLLLAYLQHASEAFRRVELYPMLADLVMHYRNLTAIRENRDSLADRFPQQLSLDDMHDLKLRYHRVVEDDTLMQHLNSIIDFSIPRMKSSLDEGSGQYEYVESNCAITPVGLTSLYAREGYLFIAQPPEKETEVYRYQVTIFDSSTEVLRSIRTEYLLKAERTISNTYEQLKRRLIREYTDLPNPAVYLVISRQKFPLANTLMPVAKRLLVKELGPKIPDALK